MCDGAIPVAEGLRFLDTPDEAAVSDLEQTAVRTSDD